MFTSSWWGLGIRTDVSCRLYCPGLLIVEVQAQMQSDEFGIHNVSIHSSIYMQKQVPRTHGFVQHTYRKARGEQSELSVGVGFWPIIQIYLCRCPEQLIGILARARIQYVSPQTAFSTLKILGLCLFWSIKSHMTISDLNNHTCSRVRQKYTCCARDRENE